MIGVPLDYRSDNERTIARKLTAILQGLVALNLEEMRVRRYPPLLSSGIVYRREPRGSELWRSLSILHFTGFGDCEDLAAALAAEMLSTGIDAHAIVRPARSERGYHAVVNVRNRDGRLVEVDPSALLIKKEMYATQHQRG